MNIPFTKYHGTGNDFILVDQQQDRWLQRYDQVTVARMCDRHFGIGADGLILIQPAQESDFEMVYFNADGGVGSLCGNGSRCAVHFAHSIAVAFPTHTFLAADGPHDFKMDQRGWIGIHMAEPKLGSQEVEHYILDTGSPHYVQFSQDLDAVDIIVEGRAIRYKPEFPQGINVNFVHWDQDRLNVKTYERGVEDMTLSCGTGATASALALALREGWQGPHQVAVDVPGGSLEIHFHIHPNGSISDIWLWGPAAPVFTGFFPN